MLHYFYNVTDKKYRKLIECVFFFFWEILERKTRCSLVEGTVLTLACEALIS